MNPDSTTYWRNLDTFSRTTIAPPEAGDLLVPGLTVLAHPDLGRIGDRAALLSLGSWQEVHLSRLEPRFAAPGSGRLMPLADPHLSRQPIHLLPLDGGKLRLVPSAKTPIEVDGEPVRTPVELPADRIRDGVVLLLAKRIVLLLHPMDPSPPADIPRFGMVGDSREILEVRRQILRVADLDVPALVRGETGTGKELVANAIHRASARVEKPFEAVNMGALPPTLAAAELFGVARGAYTGADRKRDGAFVRADHGTLFLDEIGEAPAEVQVLLLRTLETSKVQPVGAEKAYQVNVRVLAATDAQLESEIEAGRFRAPLLHRLSGYEIHLPPLRARRDDIGRLLIHFLRREMETLGEAERLEGGTAGGPAWLPGPLVAKLALYPWPGNVRQLANVARQLVIANRGEPALRITAEIESLLAEADGVEERPTAPELVVARVEESGSAVLKTLLVTDLVRSTDLVDALGDAAVLSVMTRHDREARSLLVDYGGQEIDKSDGFLFLFDRPIDALGYALDYHERLASLSQELGVRLEARAGIHVGEVFLRRNDPDEVARGAKTLEVEGIAKPMTARLMSLAAAGQTLLTRAAFELARVAAKGDHPLVAPVVRWLEHGSYRLQGVGEAVSVCEVGVAGIAPLEAPAGHPKAERVTTAAPELEAPAVAEASQAKKRYRSPTDVSEEELLQALETNAFRLQPTAAALGISRTSLYALIDGSSRIRKARDLTRDEIEACRDRLAGDLDAMAAALEVSRKGLSRRMTQLGLE